MAPDPDREAREPCQRVGHSDRGRRRRQDVGLFPVELDTGVLGVERRDRGDPERRGASAGLTAGEAVAAGVEAGTRDENVRLVLAQRLLDLGAKGLTVGGRAVVAADEGRDDGPRVAQLLLQARAGADRPLLDGKGVIAGLLGSDASEELVEVVDDAQFGQGAPAPCLIWTAVSRCGTAMRC
jgi:hypothetical protein